MLRLELLGLLLLACTQILTEHYHESQNQHGHHRRSKEIILTREVRVKEGRLRGKVVQPKTIHNLQLVDVFVGIPYAEPPVGSLRFSPPQSPRSWREVRHSLEFAPVCPQILPNLQEHAVPVGYKYLERHLSNLRNQSEDCLYLNIYAPHQAENQRNLRKYPVMVFIHGDKWNSGNPYDGTILAAYGNVVFVTINFRLGILGFLRPGIRDDAASNFGLLDQIAALLWLRENIAEFGGDPNSVTLVGHGTGAIFANLLLISPVANKKGLFKRAILMSGSAMSADAIGKAPLQITKQVAHALNCPTTNDRELAGCLRNQDIDTLLRVKIHKPKYVPAYAPLIDHAVIPDKPFNLMENVQLFGRFDLMYGVTTSERFHILSPVALLHGMLDGQRDEILRDHAKATHELEPDLILSKVLEQYGDFSSGFTSDYATKNRDMVLEALSDSGTVAPLIMTANLHSRANPKSYMYVFSHPKAMQDYSGQHLRTVHGEELPYVLGDPLDTDSRGRYNMREMLFSEAIMNWWCSFAYIGNPNVAKRYPYLTDGSMEWGRYEIDWPEYDPVNQTYFNLTIPPNIGVHYRSADMQFWNEDLPNLLKHQNKEISGSSRPRGPRPQILDFADGIGKYANGSSRKYETYGGRYTTPSSVTDSSTEKSPFSIVATTTGDTVADEVATVEPSTLNSSLMIMVFTFVLVFILINITVVSLYIYHKKQNTKEKEKSLKRRFSEKKDDSAKRSKIDKHDNCGQIGYKSDSKPDLNDVIKNDKAYDNNSNFGRRSKLSRQNSSSTIDTHIKVREWIQQEIVHRCSPRFLRKTRETLQKEHQEKLSKQQQEEKQRMEQEALRERKDEPIYDESPALVVRPGKKSKLPKVSVAIDATPATRTESILNQVPIELTKSNEVANEYEQAFNPDQLMAPQVVVIEHHHSRSDPLPMESVLKTMKPNFSTPRIYESDSGSASSLYAKINPKLKSRLPRPGLGTSTEVPVSEESKYENLPDEEIYVKTILTTFGTNDVNVTCREPTVERECISPEEALKTIKRRNYPKVLPDIEKRRSLPAPSSLFVSKQHASLLKDYKNGNKANLSSSQPPLPPPRIFGPCKSLEKGSFLAEESEIQSEGELAITTNLHVGPLMRRQDSAKNNSDPSIIDSLEGGRTVQAGGSVDTIYANPKCPLHGGQYPFSPTSQSVDEDIGNPAGFLETGNPNWYKPSVNELPIAAMASATSEPQIVIGRDERQLVVPEAGLPATEPKIVITPRLISPCQTNQKPSLSTRPDDKFDHETKTEPRRNGGSSEGLDSANAPSARETEKREPRIIITAREPRICAQASSLKQPKIIIKPTATLPRNRDQRNIPKVSAIPSPEQQNCQNSERDRALELREKPLLREKPRVTRIPSFSRKREEPGIEKPSYVEKTEIVQRVEAATSKITNTPSTSDAKSGIPTPTTTAEAAATTTTTKSEKSASTDSSSASNGNSSNSNTGTIKRKPASKK